MVKVTIIKVFQPNIFLGTDLELFDKVSQACNHIRNNESLLLPCNDITPQTVLLYDFNNQLIRLRVLSAINPNTYRCLLIDYGRIEEVKKHRMFLIPMNQLQIAPAVKLYKITGIVPAGLNISNEGVDIRATLRESEEWIRASYKFVCQIFQENAFVSVSYVKECSKDKALVEVFVVYNNKRENLKDLLIREHYAFPLTEDHSVKNNSDDKGEYDGTDSMTGESISKYLDEIREEEQDCVPTIPTIGDVVSANDGNTPDNCDSLCTNKSTYGTLDEISVQILNNKVKSWLVTKLVETNHNGESTTIYQYKNPPRPILSYQNDQLIAPFLKDTMVYHKTKSLLLIQAHMIPSILRGINAVSIAPPRKGKSMGLVMPVLQKIATKPESKKRSFNPLAIILCTSWKKVKELNDSARSFVNFIKESKRIRKPRIVQAYAGQKEKKIMISILEGCDILIITPKCLQRLLKTHEFFKLNELEILGLDDAENLIAHNLDALKEIFIYKRTGAIESGNEVQLIATATNWTSGLQSFVQNELGSMFMLTVNNPLEIAIFEQLTQKLIEHDKEPMGLYEKLLTYLEMTESTIKRTIIFASDDRLIGSIYKYIMQKGTFDLKLMLGSKTGSELKQIEREWNQYRGYVNMPVLLISDEALGRNDISIFNAQTILHADINPTSFGSRLNFLRDKFSELTFLRPTQIAPVPDMSTYHSYIFVCAATLELSHANFLYKFLGRCNSERPVWLQEKAIDFVLNKEKSKVINEICAHIKVKGECQFPACTKRHIVLADVDKPLLPNRGQIKFRLLHLVSPSNFFVRIIEHKVANESHNSEYKSQYTNLKMSVMKYFNVKENIQGVNQKFIQPGFIGAIRLKDMLERVVVLKMNVNKSTKINVKLIDNGMTMVVDHCDLLTLPKDLIDVPAQAVEVFLTGIRPLDNEEHYHEESCTFAHDFLDGKDLYGVIMLCIGKTLWVDSVTQLTHHRATKISVYDKNLSVELIEKDFVERNPGHIQRLIRLCTGKIDIWNSASQAQSDVAQSRAPVPIMRKFTYKDDPLQFEELVMRNDDEDFCDGVKNECTILRILSPEMMFVSKRDTRESIRQMQHEIMSLIDSIETLPFSKVEVGSRVLYCVDCDWLRGYVVAVDSASAVIWSLDWATVTTYTTEGYVLKKLPTEYQQLPYHAVMVGLRHCAVGQPFSDDVNDVIENFVNKRVNKSTMVLVAAYGDDDQVDGQALFECPVDQEVDLLRCWRKYSVSMSRRAAKPGDDDEELFNVLVQRQCVVPAAAWVHIILPECKPFLSRLERSGSIAHMALDILSTRDRDRRLKLSHSMERIIGKHVAHYETTMLVPGNVDTMLHTLVVLLHFVQDQEMFMAYYRSLVVIVSLPYRAKLPIDHLLAEERFTIGYVAMILYSYPSIVYHMLNHLHMTVKATKLSDCEVFLDLFKTLLVDSSFVKSFLAEPTWTEVLAECVGGLSGQERQFEELMDMAVQLVMLCDCKQPVLAGLLTQCCRVLEASETSGSVSVSVWSASLTVVACLVHNKLYYPVLRRHNLFSVLLDRLVTDYELHQCWAEVHESSLELLMAMWPTGAVDRPRLRTETLSTKVKSLTVAMAGNERLARLYTDLVMEESCDSVVTAPVVVAGGSLIPDADAGHWMKVKDDRLMRRQKHSYRRVYENKGAMDDTSDEDDDRSGGNGSDDSGSTSDLDVGTFNRQGNPADEDNVAIYDQA